MDNPKFGCGIDLLYRCIYFIQKWFQFLDPFMFCFTLFIKKYQLPLICVIWSTHGLSHFYWCIGRIFLSFIKASTFNPFEEIVIISTEFRSVRSRTIFWSCCIRLYFSTPLLFWYFSILDFNYFSFLRIYCAFVK